MQEIASAKPTSQHLMDVIGDRDFSVNVISKSGTTTEPAIAFRIFKEMLEKKYGKAEAAKRIYATTDKARGALKKLATEEGYEDFVVPDDDIGGRFSRSYRSRPSSDRSQRSRYR